MGGGDLVKKLSAYGYEVTRQTGSHLRLTRTSEDGEHHITVPRHDALRVGTLNSILTDVAGALGRDKRDLIEALFG